MREAAGIALAPPFFAGSPGADPIEVFYWLRCVSVPGMRRMSNVEFTLMVSLIHLLADHGDTAGLRMIEGTDCPLDWGP